MRTQLWIKLSMLAALAAFTFFVTSSVLARGKQRRPRRANTDNVPGAPAMGKMGITPGEYTPPPVGLDTSFASGAMHSIKVDTAAKFVHIVASASIRDTRPGISYVWAVRALHPKTGKVLFEKRYDNQMFTIPPEQQMHPTFEDTIELPLEAGPYRVELVAFMDSPTNRVADLDDPGIASSRGPAGSAPINLRD